jgi:hypothetical protein
VLREFLLGAEHLAIAIAAGHVRTLLGHDIPEERGDGAAVGPAGQLVLPGRAEDLGELGVRVEAGKPVLAFGQGIEDRMVVESLGKPQIGLLACNRGQLGQHVVHAAVFVAQHSLHLGIAELVGSRLDPCHRLFEHLEGLAVIAKHVDIQESRIDLVQCVPRGPDRLARLNAVDETLGEGAQIAGGELRLALGQLGDRVRGLLPEPLVAGAGVHHRRGREEMAETVPADLALGLFPTPQGLGRRRQARAGANVVQQAVGVEAQQVLTVEFHRVLEGSVEQPYLG